MENFVKRMIEEHSQLVVRITKLHSYIYSENSRNDGKVEFANKCIQLSAMKQYEEALRARLEIQGVFYEDGQYFEHTNSIVVEEDENPEDAPEESNENPNGE